VPDQVHEWFRLPFVCTWTQTTAKTNRYGSDTESPDWTAEDTTGTFTRNIQGPSGDPATVMARRSRRGQRVAAARRWRASTKAMRAAPRAAAKPPTTSSVWCPLLSGSW
jgi:hypothetical protein